MNITNAIDFLEKHVPNPSAGLPDELFYYISKTTPLVNVDLLIKDEKGRTLLSWRNDKYCGKGWHVPGGIVRFKETLEERVKKVAETEIGAGVTFETTPIAINQCILQDRDIRGHFISILYKCHIPGTFIPKNKGCSRDDAGYLMWHDSSPNNLIKFHERYRKYL
ncbi:NUDIX domain-containing protein [archaeon]|nr:NUDIX domain-containing protein [Nanoarchaeota archaeon]MCG2723799.1 NUDIX domain-containing protein [archaeon]